MNQRLVVDTLEQCIAETVNQLLDVLDSLPTGDLYFQLPIKDANSVPGIVMHVIGSVEERILGTLMDLPSTRDREEELRTASLSTADIRARWETIHHQVRELFGTLPDGYLDQEFVHPRMGRVTRVDSVLNVARHASEHLGEAQLIRDLLVSGEA